MKLRTSFFNTAVLKKDITRFAPVWGLYSIFAGLILLLLWESASSAGRFAASASEIFVGMGVVNFFYAGLCAFLLFGDLFKSRMCNALHAMPMRREGWFLTHCVAGLLFCIVPNAVIALLAGLLLQQYCYTAALWLAVMVLQYLFFFGVGVFACLCAGNYLGATAVYGIVNFLALLITWLVLTFIEPVLYGVSLRWETYFNYSPVVAFSNFSYIEIDYYSAQGIAKLEEVLWSQWRYLGIAAGVGVVLMGLSVLLYRKRKLESAGDLIAVQPVQPVFLTFYALCAGAVFYLAADLASGGMEYVFLLIGLAVGYFTGRMLLEKKARVFGGKNFLRFGLMVLALAVCIITARLDPMGITRRVPAPAQVASVKISPYTYHYYGEKEGYLLTEPEDIAAITKMHQEQVDLGANTGTMYVYLCYTMKDGSQLERSYEIDPEGNAGQLLKGYYSSVKWIFGTEDVASLLKTATALEVHAYSKELPSVGIYSEIYANRENFDEKWGESGETLTFQETQTLDKNAVALGLMEAVKKDCAEGNMGQAWDYHRTDEVVATIVLERYGSSGFDITVFGNCTHTIAYLKSLSAE